MMFGYFLLFLMLSSGWSLRSVRSPVIRNTQTRCNLVSELKIAESILLSNVDTSSLIQSEVEQQVWTMYLNTLNSMVYPISDYLFFFHCRQAVGYSSLSLYFTLALYVVTLPGLYSLITRSVKPSITRRTYDLPGPANPTAKSTRQVAAEVMAYFRAQNYDVSRYFSEPSLYHISPHISLSLSVNLLIIRFLLRPILSHSKGWLEDQIARLPSWHFAHLWALVV